MDEQKKYFENLISLLEIEEREDKSQYDRGKIINSLDERIEKGVAWYQVKVIFTKIGLDKKHKVGIKKITHKDLPHNFKVGNAVSIFNIAPDQKGYFPVLGKISAVGDDFMHIAVDTNDFPELPDWFDYGSLGVEKEFNMPTYKRMKRALRKIISTNEESLSRLRDVILEMDEPRFTESTINLSELNDSFLNKYQKLAIIRVLQAEDIAIIHGPPGTGKTTTLVETIRFVLKNEDQVLVTAPSNTAVDLLTEKLSKMGLSVLRLGNPEKISSKAQKNTLDSLVPNHKDYYFLDALRNKYEKTKSFI